MFAVTLASAFSVKVQLGVSLEVEQAPDQKTVLPPPALSVTWVPTGKPADADCPDVKLKPAGLELTVTPLRPVATTVSCAEVAGSGGGGGGGPPQPPGVPPPPQVWPKLQPQCSVPPQPSSPVQKGIGRASQVFGVQPLVISRGAVTGAWPGAPELALMVTVVFEATSSAASTVSTRLTAVQPGCTNGTPLGMRAAIAGSLVAMLIDTPGIGAICCSVTSAKEIPPGPMVDGVIWKEAIGGGGLAVPPGCKVTVIAGEASSRPTPLASM